MILPAMWYGTSAQVLRNARAALSALVAGQSWEATLLDHATADTQAQSGLLVLHGPSPLLKGQLHFHCYVLHNLLREQFLERRVPSEVEDRVFRSSLESHWGVLGL